MKCTSIVLFAALLATASYGLKDFTAGEEFECVKCLCHAVSGCYFRKNCAKYSITQDYWIKAGGPSVDSSITNNDQAYKKCMTNENCIINTIIGYTDELKQDCNCDSKFDCKDRLAIHLGKCGIEDFKSHTVTRFNTCSEQGKKLGVDPLLASDVRCGIPAV